MSGADLRLVADNPVEPLPIAELAMAAREAATVLHNIGAGWPMDDVTRDAARRISARLDAAMAALRVPR